MTKSNSYKLGFTLTKIAMLPKPTGGMTPELSKLLQTALTGAGAGAVGGAALGGLEGAFTNPKDESRGRSSHMIRKILLRALQGGALGGAAGTGLGFGRDPGAVAELRQMAIDGKRALGDEYRARMQ